ncbi:MAG: UDP-N-acetylmuramoyl-L-alanine--D-glutamate ligase [Saprospirales bacterium]|nr:UDP-N-acetylmuramoyl-L-alanine--D-glutamate ligase [Saprospirales bacterium]MBK8492369.1 UDP-N-acetylmuramoyl-L-alanine--D-glutamate ligase [Saprospirales bacterium]
MQLPNRITILGGGESGVGAALLAQARGLRVFLSDQGSIAELHKSTLDQAGIPYEEGTHSIDRIVEAVEVVKSPGIPEKAPVIQALREKGIPVISEIEFAARHSNGILVGITGTNGKTTTTRLAYHLIRTAGFNVGIGGNVGNSFSLEVIEDRYDYYVLELSSFQLDNIVAFRPHIAVLLNITPDHLDRYAYKMENYTAAKLRIARNQTPKDFFLYNAEDQHIASGMAATPVRAQLLPMSMESGPEGSPLLVGGHSFFLNNPSLKGRHNRFNAQCAIQAAVLLGALPQAIQLGLDSFVNDPHRMEKVEEWNGVLYLNDSKATNVEAVYFALEAMTRPVIWIAGGVDKGNDYETLMPLVREKVKALVCLGADNAKLVQSFTGMVPQIVEVRSAAEAVSEATRLSERGDVVLLSPACASFDLFRNYEDRGTQFKEAVRELVTTTT